MKYAMLIIYALLMVGIGFYARKIMHKGVEGFLLGGRKIGPWMSAFAYGTTYFSAVVFIGYAGRIGWGHGLSGTWIGIFNALLGSMLAWHVLARRTRRMTHNLKAATMPDFFQKRFLSPRMKIFAALIIFIFLIPYSASVYLGLGYLFEATFGISITLCMVIMAVLTAIYLLLGGYLGAVLSDFIQGIIMLAGVVLTVVFVLAAPQVGGLSQGLTKLGEMGEGLNTVLGPSDKFTTLVSLVLLTGLGTWGLPQMIHKFYAISDDKAIRKGTIISTIFALIISGGAYFVGTFGRLFQGEWVGMMDAATGWPLDGAVGNADMIMPIVLQTALPEALGGIIVVLVLSASMSTLSSVVLTSASAISVDLVKGAIRPKMKEQNVVWLMRIFCGIFVLISFLIAVLKPGAIITLMSFSWGSIAGAFLAPFLYGLYWKGTTRAGVWAGMIAGLVTSLGLALFMPNSAVQAPLIGAIAMGVSLAVVPAVSWLTPKYAPQVLQEVFTEALMDT